MTHKDFPVDGDEPTSEEIAQMRAAAPAEAAAVDALILAHCSAQWWKVARVVGALMNEFDVRFAHLPFAYVQARMQALEDAGQLEIAGDVWVMGRSEVRVSGKRATR